MEGGEEERSVVLSYEVVLALHGDESSTVGIHQVCQGLVLCGFPLLLILHVIKVSVSRSY